MQRTTRFFRHPGAEGEQRTTRFRILLLNGAGIKILNQIQDDGVSHEGTKTLRMRASDSVGTSGPSAICAADFASKPIGIRTVRIRTGFPPS